MLFERSKLWIKDKLGLEPGKPLWPFIYKTYKRISGIPRIKGGLGTLPDFIIIGTMKGGTTSLFNYLIQHPNVHSGCNKEIHFFDVNFEKGEKWYRAFFPLSFKRKIYGKNLKKPFKTGESSPYYLMHPLTPKRMGEVIPKAKLVVLLRNPADRAYSHYYHNVRKKRETLSFDEALNKEKERLSGEERKVINGIDSYNYRNYSYIKRGLYAEQMERWYKHFPRDQIMIIESERFFKDPQRYTNEVLRFIGLSPIKLKKYHKVNKGSYKKRSMEPETREMLQRYFKKPNQDLYELIGKKFTWD